MELVLQVQRHPDSIALICHGHVIYGDETEALRAALGVLLLASDRVIVNLQQVRKMDCSGLGVLADIARRACQRGGTLELCSVPRNVRRMLELTRLHLAISIHQYQPQPDICRACAA